VRGDVGQLATLWGDQFEAVTLLWTLHHLTNPEETLRGVYRILKSRGKVLIGDWVLGEGQERGVCLKFTIREIQ
jgi:ubiquinone/menaquinone biosynthesis C-methylase UbiE